MEVRLPSEPKPASRFVRKSSKEAAEANRQERNSEAPPQNSQSLKKDETKGEALSPKLPSINKEPLSPKSPSLLQKSPSLKSPAPKKKPVLNAMRKEYLDAKQQELSNLLSQEQISWNILENRFASCKHVLNPNSTEPEAKIATLHRAAFDGIASCVKWCIEARADVGVSTTAGRTALHYACEGNRPDCVELLIRSQADPNQTTLGGATPLHVACMNGCSEAVKALLYTSLDVEVTVDIEVEDTRRQTPEMHAKKNPALLAIISKYLVDAEAKRKQRIALAAAMALYGNLSEAQLSNIFRAWAKEAQDAKSKAAQEAKSKAKTCLEFGGGADEHPSALEDERSEVLTAVDEASEENSTEKSLEENPRKKFVPAYALALGLG